MLAGLVAALLAGAAWFAWAREGGGSADADNGAAGTPLPLFTSLPLYWGWPGDLGAILGPNAKPHWARAAIERSRPLEPLDTLDAARLAAARVLLMVQPRPLSPEENVAIDGWVAGGGRLLLFADPVLTIESPFPMGDKRRPQDTVLLSPILQRWGLVLEFDEEQSFEEREVAVGDGVGIPVVLPGRWVRTPAGRGNGNCALDAGGLIAQCRVGQGGMVLVADAALFEDPRDDADLARREKALKQLMERAFVAAPGKARD